MKPLQPSKLLKISLLVLFLGWLLVWVMAPTKLYKKRWAPKLTKRFNSPHIYASQGTNLVLFCFPIVLMAVGGCVYLHMLKNQPQRLKREKTPMRHVAVLPTLGIVTMTEFLFFVLFIVLLLWALGNYIYTSYTGHLHMDRKDMPIWMSKFRSVALRLGYIGNICVAFLFFPVARGSSILPLFGLTSESSIKYHIWLGHISMGLFSAHTIGFLIYWGAMLKDIKNQMAEWSKEWVSNVAGEIAIAFGLIMWATSIKTIRRKMFELFYYTHQLYFVYLLFYLLHVGATWFLYILPGIFLFLIDRYLRLLQSRTSVKLVSSRTLPNGSFELNFAKAPRLVYNPTSTLFVNVPSVSRLQWHPFTVSSNSNLEDDTLSVVVSSIGEWSSKVREALKTDHLTVSVEGPYGPAECGVLNHETLVFVSGGSGITPFISIFREIMFRTRFQEAHIPKVVLICAFKTSADLSMLGLLLPTGPTGLDLSKVHLRIEAYVTRETEEASKKGKLGRQEFLFYKPRSCDTAVAPVLGPHGWLCLGLIIATSFSMFLLLLGIVSHYYISKKKNYHFSYYVLWDIFLLCASVLVAASAVFFLQKRMRINEGEQVSVEPKGNVKGDEEVESFQSEYIDQATNVHYGRRPDLADELLGLKEVDVGVLACGPRSMMHDVARICSSSQGSNLQFEAISFNW